MEQKDTADKILKMSADLDVKRQQFRDLARHKQEQKDLWSKAEKHSHEASWDDSRSQRASKS
jgi:hypothetical protein